MSGGASEAVAARRPRRPGRLGRWLLVVAVAIVTVVAGLGIGLYLATSTGEPTLVVYTYSSLLGGPGTPAYNRMVDGFEAAYHVRLDVVFPPGNLVSTLLAQASAPTADVVVGLDEITTPQAQAHGLLVPYAPPELANVSTGLIADLSPQYAAVPYEYGYLALDYNTTFAASTGGRVAQATFPELASNASWASQFLYEDPTVDITGEEFLVWQIQYYEQVLHENWTTFWTTLLPELAYKPAPDWSTAFSEFGAASGNPGLVVSYSTDPAYAAYYGASGQFNSTVSWWNGTAYGWRSVYGVGIVHGTHHLALALAFERSLLSGTVQSLHPLNEWEYPANSTVPLPSVYDAAIDPGRVVALNDGTTPAAVAQAIQGWITTYQELANRLLPP